MKECPICMGQLQDFDNKCHICGYIFPHEDDKTRISADSTINCELKI